MSQSAKVSDRGIPEAIQALLERDFGKSAASAIKFYADPKTAIANPEEYAKTLLGIFGAGAEHLLVSIIYGLGKEFGVEVHDGTTLDELMVTLGTKERTG